MPETDSSIMDFRTVFRGSAENEGSTQGTGLYLIQDENTWASHWAGIVRGNRPTAGPPVVRFAEESLVLYGCGLRPTGNYDVRIESLRLDGGTLHVSATESRPSGGPDSLSSPVHVVAVRRLAPRPESLLLHLRIIGELA